MTIHPLTPEMVELKEEILLYIHGAMMMHPRSQQKIIGPSEIGTPCDVKLAYKLQQHIGWNPRDVNWRATVGTAVHSWLEQAFGHALLPDGSERFIREQRLLIGHIDGQEIHGHSDVYDRATQTVLDWKIVGPTSLKQKKARGADQTYTWQAQLYGMGYERIGLPVRNLMIVALPSAGELHDSAFLYIPYDAAIAQQALDRADRIAKATRLLGAGVVFPQLPRAEDYCQTCAYFKAGSPSVLAGCPGANQDQRATKALASQMAGLIPGL